jgi:hypothetical protein
MPKRLKMPVWSTCLLLCSASVLTGCAQYHDPRPPERQKAELAAAIQDVVGEYEVVDARNENPQWHTRRAVVSYLPAYGVLQVIMTDPLNGDSRLTGTKCTGWHTDKNSGFSAVHCEGQKGGAVFFDVSLHEPGQRVVKDSRKYRPFEPMVVPAGSDTIDIYYGDSPEIYLVMRKK